MEAIIEEVDDKSFGVFLEATKALGQAKDSKAVDALCRALENKHEYRREYAAEALWRIGMIMKEALQQSMQGKQEIQN